MRQKNRRIKGRDGYIPYTYDSQMTKILATHDVTWSRQGKIRDDAKYLDLDHNAREM